MGSNRSVATTEKELDLAALDIEKWKVKQKEQFQRQLEKLEQHHINTLSDEWNKRKEIQDDEYKALRLKIMELEHQLEASKTQLERTKSQLKNSNESAATHVNEIEILRLKIIDLEKQLERYKYQLNESKNQLEEMKELVAKKEESIEQLKADRLEIDQILLMQVDKNKKLDDAMSKMKLSI